MIRKIITITLAIAMAITSVPILPVKAAQSSYYTLRPKAYKLSGRRPSTGTLRSSAEGRTSFAGVMRGVTPFNPSGMNSPTYIDSRIGEGQRGVLAFSRFVSPAFWKRFSRARKNDIIVKELADLTKEERQLVRRGIRDEEGKLLKSIPYNLQIHADKKCLALKNTLYAFRNGRCIGYLTYSAWHLNRTPSMQTSQARIEHIQSFDARSGAATILLYHAMKKLAQLSAYVTSSYTYALWGRKDANFLQSSFRENALEPVFPTTPTYLRLALDFTQEDFDYDSIYRKLLETAEKTGRPFYQGEEFLKTLLGKPIYTAHFPDRPLDGMADIMYDGPDITIKQNGSIPSDMLRELFHAAEGCMATLVLIDGLVLDNIKCIDRTNGIYSARIVKTQEYSDLIDYKSAGIIVIPEEPDISDLSPYEGIDIYISYISNQLLPIIEELEDISIYYKKLDKEEPLHDKWCCWVSHLFKNTLSTMLLQMRAVSQQQEPAESLKLTLIDIRGAGEIITKALSIDIAEAAARIKETGTREDPLSSRACVAMLFLNKALIESENAERNKAVFKVISERINAALDRMENSVSILEIYIDGKITIATPDKQKFIFKISITPVDKEVLKELLIVDIFIEQEGKEVFIGYAQAGVFEVSSEKRDSYVSMRLALAENELTTTAFPPAIFISPEFRRRGIAGAAMSVLMQIAQLKAGSFKAEEVAGEEAKRFYQKIGFMPYTLQEDYMEFPLIHDEMVDMGLRFAKMEILPAPKHDEAGAVAGFPSAEGVITGGGISEAINSAA